MRPRRFYELFIFIPVILQPHFEDDLYVEKVYGTVNDELT